MKEHYLSVAALPGVKGHDLVTWAERRGGWLWCLWDIAPSPDVRRAPLISGYVASQDDMLATAAMLGMTKRLRFSPDHHVNANLVELARDARPFLSVHGGQWAVWASPTSYLIGQPPLALRDDDALPLRSIACGDTIRRPASFLQRYRARQRLAARAARPASERCQPTIVTLLYARDWYGRDTLHRVIRHTPRRVMVDALPFRPTVGFLHPAWRLHLVDIAALPRDTLEATGQVEHRPTGRAYHVAPPAGFLLYGEEADDDLDAFMNDDYPPERHRLGSTSPPNTLIELPENSLPWALTALGFPADTWPLPLTSLKAAYRRAARHTHPDRGGQAADFRAARGAYEYLASLALR
ncbi:hypothetical protein [Ectothiorhodospira mobilis]|uniref:hypothetical protein n=1 Tax=Ectothiorhodospira mobilis TaxID=195064 RepID=UPI0019060B54|nr:hypothetical protein [Ectothiorhodospira mobilis]MBK1691106.1 hypothetical protein [Ectothiorhodospira mobilis]